MIVLGYSGYAARSREKRRHSPFATTRREFRDLFRFSDGQAPFSCFPLGFFGHDGAAALVADGEVVACAAEERFVRVKHGLNLAGNTLLPKQAVRYCLEEAGLGIEDVDLVAHYCDFRAPAIQERLALLAPHLAPDDLARTAACYEHDYASMLRPEAVRDQFETMTGTRSREIMGVRHHLAHAASAYFTSGFRRALILTLDGTGERESSVLWAGDAGTIEEYDRTPLPTSLGTLYLILTVFLGFRSLGDEYKVMGLAAYGDPARFRSFFDSIIEPEERGGYSTSRLASPGFEQLLEDRLGACRKHDEDLAERHADIAAGLQDALVRTVLRQLRYAREETGLERLCLAGGVALNCALNGEIARSELFREIFVQPAANDEGASVGAALYAYHRRASREHDRPSRWRHAYLGPQPLAGEILDALQRHEESLRWQKPDDIACAAAEQVARRGVIGWFQGRMEFGPRALGNRSIVADPRDPAMKDRINTLVKWREPFRPFAPATLAEHAADWFDMRGLESSPFMLFTVPVRASRRHRIPAVTHVDGSARVQTVERDTNPRFWSLIDAFRSLTGVPVVLNTSFNVNREPMVCSPGDAIACFLRTKLDCLAIGDYLVEKKA